jgi:hypothetical protein
VHAEQMQFVDIYGKQISRWRAEQPSPARIRELDRMDAQNRQLRDATKAVSDSHFGFVVFRGHLSHRRGHIGSLSGRGSLTAGWAAAWQRRASAADHPRTGRSGRW